MNATLSTLEQALQDLDSLISVWDILYIYIYIYIYMAAAEIDIQISWPVKGQHLYSALYYYSTPDIYSTPMSLSSIIIISHID